MTVVPYSISYFLPIILSRELGYSVSVSQVLQTPPYFLAAMQMYFEGWLGDKYRIRGPIIAWNALQTIVGLCILAFVTHSPAVQYFAVFVIAAGCNSNIPAILAWQATNIRGQWRRAFCSASLISFGGVGAIAGALVFRSQDAPRYLPGIYASIT
jgi:MFS family permease